MSTSPLTFLTLELSSKVKDPVDIPSIIKTTILTRNRKKYKSENQDSQFMYEVEESLWKTSTSISEEAFLYHGISLDDLKYEQPIEGKKIKGYVVYWANVYTFRILQLNKVKFENNRFIFLNFLLKAIGEDGNLSMVAWACKINKDLELGIDDTILMKPESKAICLTIIYDYISKIIFKKFGFSIDKHYDLLAAVQYHSAVKAKANKKIKIHELMNHELTNILHQIETGIDIKMIKKEYFKRTKYEP